MTGNEYHDYSSLAGSDKGSAVTSLIIAAAALIVVLLVVVILNTNDSDPDQAAEPLPEVEEEQLEEPAAEETVPTSQQPHGVGGGPEGEVSAIDEEGGTSEGEEEEAEEPVSEEGSAKDIATIETTAYEWLKDRTGDPDVIMVTTGDLDDMDAFYDQYDLSEDTVLVYMVDSVDDEFLSVIFGPPYSEWSLMAVFIWRDNQWEFLREEDISM
jgi:hypothetical protein